MEVSDDKAPLIRRRDFRFLSQNEEPAVVQCCGFESTKLGRIPVIRTIFKKKDSDESGTFSSSFAVLLSMLGAAVGTGNIWRFPRITANNAQEGGALVFLIVWFMFLWLWSIPIIIIEYGVGRFTKKAPIEAFAKLLGPSYRFMGAFQVVAGICILSYYSVLVGWCGYYMVYTCVHPLPENISFSNGTWNSLQDSHWPVALHGIMLLLASACVLGGVATIEPVNKVIVPILLGLIVFSFYWAIFLPHASEGIIHMFSPNWASLKSSQVWLDAISQNAWDTGAGAGSFLTLASFMKRSQGAVKLGIITPILNNVVSLLCGILIFSTVFSVQLAQGISNDMIVETLRYNGPSNSGLTFIWMPLLYGSIKGGRILAVLFFLCITLAGLSSMITSTERPVHALEDFGSKFRLIRHAMMHTVCVRNWMCVNFLVKRVPATILVVVILFLLGCGSALDSNILVNQDTVWSYALVLSGCFMIFIVLRYGVMRFRRKLYNEFGIGDWPLPIIWVFLVVFITPFEGIGLLIWWIVEQIINNPDTWWQITIDSLATVFTEWAVVFLALIGLNWWMSPLVIYQPNNQTLKSKILDTFFNLTPKPLEYNNQETSGSYPMLTGKKGTDTVTSNELLSSDNEIQL